MAKKVFNLVINTDDLDPNDRCYYDYVDWPIDSRASKEEVDKALAEIYEQMAQPVDGFATTAFHSWFYNRLSGMYQQFEDILWDAIDTYVQDELTERFRED